MGGRRKNITFNGDVSSTYYFVSQSRPGPFRYNARNFLAHVGRDSRASNLRSDIKRVEV